MAAPVWKKFMQYAVDEQKTPANFANPPSWVEVDKVSICRATGYRARGGCQAVPLYFPKGRSPTASCPVHGGSYRAADNDPRGPRLFLVEQDDTYLARRYSEQPKESSGKKKSSSQTEESSSAHQQVTAPATNAAVPRPSAPAPKRQEPQLSEVEQRYRQLLKQYGLE